MARHFNAAAFNYAVHNAAPVAGPPFMLASYVRPDNVTGSYGVMDITNSGVADHQYLLLLRGDDADQVQFATRAGGGFAMADTSTGYTANTWHLIVAVAHSATDRRVFIDNGSKGTDVANLSPAGLNRMDIGRWGDSTPSGWLLGSVAWAGLWNVAPSDAEVATFSGVHPWKIRPDGRVALWPLWGYHSPEIDLTGNYQMTLSGTTRVEGPPVPPMWMTRRSGLMVPPAVGRPWYVAPPVVYACGIGRMVTLAWTSSEDGDVEFELDGCGGRPLLRGALHRVEFRPSETQAPDANWDCVLEDIWGVDALGGLGMNRSATDPEAAFPYFSLGTSGHGERGVGGELTLKISGAGEYKSGVVRILTIDP